MSLAHSTLQFQEFLQSRGCVWQLEGGADYVHALPREAIQGRLQREGGRHPPGRRQDRALRARQIRPLGNKLSITDKLCAFIPLANISWH